MPHLPVHTRRIGEPRLTGRTRVVLRGGLWRAHLIVEVEEVQAIERCTAAIAPGEGRREESRRWRPLEADDLHGRRLTLGQSTTLDETP